MRTKRAREEHPADQSLFGAELRRPTKRGQAPRLEAVYCQKCDAIDTVLLNGGSTIATARCRQCGGDVVTPRSGTVKARFYRAVAFRCRDLTIAAAAGAVDVARAVDYAEYAAHTAFRLRLAPYGPEPQR